MYSLWWSNHIVLAHVSKVAKNLCVVCENIARVYKCLILWWFEMWENQFNSHTIITAWWGLSPSRYILQLPHLLETRLQPYLKAFWFFLLLYSLHIFSFWAYHAWAYRREKRNTQLGSATNITILLCRSTQILYMIGGL